MVTLHKISLMSLGILVAVCVFLILGIYYSVFSHNSVQRISNLGLSSQLRPVDPLYADQRNSLDNIQLEAAWDITTGSREIIVAIIDDAVEINHPDLADNIYMGHDFVENDSDPSPGSCVNTQTQTESIEQHGTQVAGVIGAVGNNNQGISGINWQVKLMPLRIGCYYQQKYETQAVAYAIKNNAHIINASYGGPDFLARNPAVVQLLKDAEQQVLFITAAGNYHVNNDELPVYPGNIQLPNVLTVAASDAKNLLTEWTQYGANSVDLSAPGVNLQSTAVGKKYQRVDGSSFSTAVVSGVAALIKSYDFNNILSPADLKAVIQGSVSPVAGQTALSKTAGVVNAKAALDLIASPQPVMTVVNVKYLDINANFSNGLIDSNENGEVVVELENLWADIVAGSISIRENNENIDLNTRLINLVPMSAGERREIRIPISSKQFSGHQRIRFQLDLNLSGASKSVSYQRAFEIQTGPLTNNILLNARIQQNRYDDYQYFHLNVPANMQRVAIEMEYNPSDSRDMGLLATFDSRPLIHFREFNGRDYWDRSQKKSDFSTGFERIDFTLNGEKPSILNIMVFNAPPSNPSASFTSNKAFTLKGCFYSETDGNLPPNVDAGLDRSVNPGDSVVLTANVSDTDGEISRYYWQSNSSINFTILNENQIQFIAPNSGDVTFSLIAIDNQCKKSVDSVTVRINEISGNEPEGLILNPRNLNIEENSGFDVIVSGVFNTQEVSELSMVSGPSGVTFVDGVLSWKNASPTGIYFVKFSAKAKNQTLSGTITVEITKRGVGNGGGGCVMRNNAQFDPLFFIYVLISFLFISKKRYFSIKCV